jgi:magnesium chelatase accessory protein
VFSTPQHLDWARDGADWPNREASRFLRIANIEWHVQVMGPAGAPALLLLHGTGASSHSFRDLMPLLATEFRVVAPDLPGHGFTRSDGADLSLPGMARALGKLSATLQAKPVLAVGHSASVAIAMQMALDGTIEPYRIIGFNAALKPIEGDTIFSPLAKMLFLNPFVPRLFSSLPAIPARRNGCCRALARRSTGADVISMRGYWQARRMFPARSA